VNGFHVHAVGWILTVNALALRPPEARELSGLWADLVRARAEDLRRAHPLFRLLFPRSLRLSEPALGALAALVEQPETPWKTATAENADPTSGGDGCARSHGQAAQAPGVSEEERCIGRERSGEKDSAVAGRHAVGWH
jgi:hypothetical protein